MVRLLYLEQGGLRRQRYRQTAVGPKALAGEHFAETRHHVLTNGGTKFRDHRRHHDLWKHCDHVPCVNAPRIRAIERTTDVDPFIELPIPN